MYRLLVELPAMQGKDSYSSPPLFFRLPQSSIHGSPTAPCTTSQFAPAMERYHQEDTHLTEAHLADRHFFSLLPPINPQIESVSEVNPESVKGNQVKKPQSNSEEYLMQMEKQNQPKVSQKVSK